MVRLLNTNIPKEKFSRYSRYVSTKFSSFFFFIWKKWYSKNELFGSIECFLPSFENRKNRRFWCQKMLIIQKMNQNSESFGCTKMEFLLLFLLGHRTVFLRITDWLIITLSDRIKIKMSYPLKIYPFYFKKNFHIKKNNNIPNNFAIIYLNLLV